jgi:hypothetical protein
MQAEDKIKDLQDKIDDPNTSEEDKKEAKKQYMLNTLTHKAYSSSNGWRCTYCTHLSFRKP